MERDPYREFGKITAVKAEEFRGDGGEPNTVWVTWEAEGTGQGFGGLMLDKKGIKVFLDMLCDTFGTRIPEQLVGKPCYALRAFGGWNEPIWGLESGETGRRFTLKSFRTAMGYEAPSRFEETTKSLKSSIAMHERRAAEDRLTLNNLKKTYKDWD